MWSADIVIIGGGLAGASAFYHLSETAHVLLLEAEASPGLHASSQNAAMVRRLAADPAIARMARRGARFLDAPPEDLRLALTRLGSDGSLVRRTGSLLLAETVDGVESLVRMLEDAQEAGLDARWLEPREITARLPLIEEERVSGGAWCAEDGVADPQALLTGLLHAGRSRGSQCHFGVRVQGAEMAGGRLARVHTSSGPVECSAVVDAAGAWAASVGRNVNGSDVPLTPFRRHIAVSGPMPEIAGWPIVWDVERGFYVRPEAGRALYSACDQDPSDPCVPEVDPEIHLLMAQKAQALLPGLPLDVGTTWAGLRTYPPDGRFVIGPDPALPGLYWLAGLGGHGVTVCGAAGQVLASAVTDGIVDADFSPHRFVHAVSKA